MAKLQGSAKYLVWQTPFSLGPLPRWAVTNSIAVSAQNTLCHSVDRVSVKEEVVTILVLVLCFGC